MATREYKIYKYEVTDTQGVIHAFECRWMFHDNGSLTFRDGEKGDSQVVGAFAPGCWISVKLIKEEDNGATPRRSRRTNDPATGPANDA